MREVVAAVGAVLAAVLSLTGVGLLVVGTYLGGVWLGGLGTAGVGVVLFVAGTTWLVRSETALSERLTALVRELFLRT